MHTNNPETVSVAAHCTAAMSGLSGGLFDNSFTRGLQDGGQDVFFCGPAKRCHCPISINWSPSCRITLWLIVASLPTLRRISLITSRPERCVRETAALLQFSVVFFSPQVVKR